MGLKRLTSAKQEILSILSSNPDEEFYVNELIRLTSRYPNSIEKALESLSREGLVRHKEVGRNKFYGIVPSHVDELREALPKIELPEWNKLVNRAGTFQFALTVCLSNAGELQKTHGAPLPTYWYNSLTSGLYYLKKELASLGKAISEKLESEADFADGDIELCRKSCRILLEESKAISKVELAEKTNGELGALLDRFYRAYLKVFPFLTTPFAIERFFETKIRERVFDQEALELLLSPVSTADEEVTASLALAGHAKEHGFGGSFEEKLSEHWQNFCWLSLFDSSAPPLTREYFSDEVRNILERIKNPKEEIRKQREADEARKKELDARLKELTAPESLQRQVRFLQEYIVLRTYRKNAICRAHYNQLPLLREIAFRLNIDAKKVFLLSYEELHGCLEKRISRARVQRLITEREKGWAILRWAGKICILTGTKEIVKAMEQYRISHASPARTKALKGRIACRGNAIGKVKIIHKLSDLGKIREGDILVTKMTTPDFVVAMRKCGGIITDEGGVTCHAAIVSREMNIPCITATRIATASLKDNDLVELDANTGVARIIEARKELPETRRISGKRLFPGKVSGRVVVVNDISDFPKVRKGDILCAAQATPEYLSCLYKAAGLIVDEDSVTSHAALYAKALELPTVMGTANAREILQDGETVVLDADNGMVLRE